MRTLVNIVLILQLFGCSAEPTEDELVDTKELTFTPMSTGQRRSGAILIPIDVSMSGFNLIATSASAYSISLAGCQSSLTGTVTKSNLDGIEVYDDDRNCLAKLSSLTVGGIEYTSSNPGAVDFTTWLAGDTATFTSGAGVGLDIKVVEQLSNPVNAGNAVHYAFSDLLDGSGDTTLTEIQVGAAQVVSVNSDEAPQFNVITATFLGTNAATLAPQFTFRLACVNDPILPTPTKIAMSTGSATNTLCSATDLNIISYKFVIDTYSSLLTVDDLQTIFATAGTSVAIPTNQYQVSTTNEGFDTIMLEGPGSLATAGNNDMILIIKGAESYTYFNVDVQLTNTY